MVLGLLTLILSRCHELLIFASFLSLYSRQLIKKNNNNKTSKFEIHAMQNLHEIIFQTLCLNTLPFFKLFLQFIENPYGHAYQIIVVYYMYRVGQKFAS